jgi:hypothetical protein
LRQKIKKSAEWMLNDTDTEKAKYLEKNLYHCPRVYH